MQLGVLGLSTKISITAAIAKCLAIRCDSLGYESWWSGEDVVLPSA